jgi:hypothetical protein
MMGSTKSPLFFKLVSIELIGLQTTIFGIDVGYLTVTRGHFIEYEKQTNMEHFHNLFEIYLRPVSSFNYIVCIGATRAIAPLKFDKLIIQSKY